MPYMIHKSIDAMPCHAMPCHAIISYNTFHGITCHYYTLHYIKLARTTITWQPHAYLYYPYLYLYMYVYIYIYSFIHSFIYIYIYTHVNPHYCWFTPHVGEVSIPQDFETSISPAQNSGIKLYIGEFGPGLSLLGLR